MIAGEATDVVSEYFPDQVPDFRSSPPGDQCDDQVCMWDVFASALVWTATHALFSCVLLQHCRVPAEHVVHEVSLTSKAH